jgi:hypothetical protein
MREDRMSKTDELLRTALRGVVANCEAIIDKQCAVVLGIHVDGKVNVISNITGRSEVVRFLERALKSAKKRAQS